MGDGKYSDATGAGHTPPRVASLPRRRASRKGGIPLYYQIMRDLKEQIVSGKLGPGDRLPSEAEFTRRFQVSRVVIRQALRILDEQALIVRVKGKGTFVSDAVREDAAPRISGSLEDLIHIGADTTGDLLSKGVFIDRARGYYKGMIVIERSAKGTDSFLGEFAMLLAKQARSVTIPSLEIDQPDVRRAAHSSSVGPIDEDEIFYLMSRGIPREVARKFIVLGFLEPVVARIPLGAAQDRLRQLLEQKWPQTAAPIQQAA